MGNIVGAVPDNTGKTLEEYREEGIREKIEYKAPSATNSMPPEKKPKSKQSVLAKRIKSRRRLHSAAGKGASAGGGE